MLTKIIQQYLISVLVVIDVHLASIVFTSTHLQIMKLVSLETKSPQMGDNINSPKLSVLEILVSVEINKMFKKAFLDIAIYNTYMD